MWQFLPRFGADRARPQKGADMNCLILYGTTEGQTRKIVSFLRDRIAAGTR
jgi:hypothetical protein